ncbi:MAG: envelope stress response membrane protein PspB [Pontibacterium sp.]
MSGFAATFAAIFATTTLFILVVVPLWLILHYAAKMRSNRGLSTEDKQALEDAYQSVERLEARIETLETILDSEQPEWRSSRAKH